MSQKRNILSDNFKKDIRINVINRMFPNLIQSDSNLIFEYLIAILELVVIKNNLNSNPSYETLLKSNDYQDLISLLFLLFPYIDTTESTTKSITSLNDIYVILSDSNDSKLPNGVKSNEFDKYEPKFKFSNVQYNRIKRSNQPKSIQYEHKFLEHNFILLKETIASVANKLYVNWNNIYPIPYLPSYFTKLPLFQATNFALRKHKITDYTDYVALRTPIISNYVNNNNNSNNNNVNDNSNNKDMIDIITDSLWYNGLQINDIYSTIRYNLYEQVYNIKWLLYDVVTSEQNRYNSTKMIVHLLDEKLYLETVKKKLAWNFITSEQRTTFINSWVNFANIVKGAENQVDISIMKYFTKFFNTANFYNLSYKYGGYIKIDKETYSKYKKNIVITQEEYALYLNTFLTIKPEWAYDYLLNTFTNFYKTWYGYKIKENTNNNYKSFTLNNKEAYITYKNIYNFAKSLTSFNVNKGTKDEPDYKFIQYPILWKALSPSDKKIVLERINWDSDKTTSIQTTTLRKGVMSWFDISGNLKIIADPKTDIASLNEAIHKYIMKDLALIIFETMTFNGLLSQFKLELTTDNAKIIESNLNENKLIVQNSYYYITNTKYTELHIEYQNSKKQYEKANYLKYMTSNIGMDLSGSWNTIYALNWVSQISFYHRYLNNRVIYVTGGTGVGKSTQVPKLLLYSLKMIDYNYNGKIMCTQPRIPPTRKSGATISSQLGVPVFRYDPMINEYVDSDNYYVQFKYAKKNEIHTAKTNDSLNLTIVTDGILYEVIKNNPILKKQITLDNQVVYDKTGVNELDIIMVDEAHEHNKNMDLILSLMKVALYYNNNVKLVIVSATMSADEPRYRRNYRNINDNRMYPFNMMLETNKLDRINVDRRIHIFPPSRIDPGATTFPIQDFWDQPKEKLESIILELSIKGDVLVFQPGKAEIRKLVKSLNSKLPANAIAIPYHGEMDQTKKEIVETLTPDTKKTLRYPKTVSYDEELGDSDTLVPYGSYDRIIIVATNLAEASITIGTLKYVVETGTQKVLIYDQEDRTNKIKLTGISQSSMEQRRGRVGRKSPGAVYYFYPKGAMQFNKINFDISTSNIYPVLYDLLKESNDNIPMFDVNFDINNPSKFNNIKNIINSNILKKKYPGNLDNIIIKQYAYQTKKKLVFIDYVGNMDHYDYLANEAPPIVYSTGFSADTINDYMGNFYIIHPDELVLIRNIYGSIVGSTDTNVQVDSYSKKIIKSKKMEFAWNNLVGANAVYINRVNSINIIEKTAMSALFKFLMKELKLSTDDTNIILDNINTIIYAMVYGTLDDVIKVIPMLIIIDSQLSGLVSSSTSKLPYLLGRYSNSYGDLVGLRRLCDDILQYSDVTKSQKLYTSSGTNEQLVLQYKKMILHGDNREIVGLTKSDKFIINGLLKLKSKGQLLNDDNILSIEESKLVTENITELISSNFEENESNIATISKITGVNSTVIRRYIWAYLSLHKAVQNYLQVDTLTVSGDTKLSLNIINDIKNIKQKIASVKQTNEIKDRDFNLIKTFISGLSYRLFKRVCNNDYIHCFSLRPKTYKIPKFMVRGHKYFATFLDPSKIGSYLLGCSIQAENSTITIINNVTINTIQEYAPFTYLPTIISKKYANMLVETQENKKEIQENKENEETNKETNKETKDNDTLCIYDYKYEITKIKTELVKHFSTRPYYLLIDINSQDDRFTETLVKYITEQKNYANTNYNK